MGLEDKFGKVPLRRIFRRFFEALFDPENGHDHDGENSKAVSPATAVENNSIITAKIQDGAVTGDKIAANAVTTAKLADGAVTGAKIPAQNITTAHLADENVTAPKVADGAVTADKIGAGAVVEEKLGDGAVTAAKIGASAVEEEKINDGAVTADKIGAGAVVEEKLGDGAVTAAKIGASAVEEEKINDGAVTADKIGAGAVTAVALNADVAGNGVGLNTGTNAIEVKVDDATIEISSDTLQVKAGGVDTTQLTDDAVTNDKLANIPQGSVKVGGANDAPTDLDASGDGTILIGDGTDLKSVAVTGDVTITNAGVTAIGAGKVTSAMLASDANLAAVIAAGFGATQTVAQDTGSTVELLVADPAEDRACLVMVLVKVSLAGDAEFSIQDADGTEMLAVPPDTAAGTVLTGAGVLAATKALNIVPTAGSAGEIQAFVLSLPAA